MKAKFRLFENSINGRYNLSDTSLDARFNVPSSIGTKDYNHLYNKPSINGFELQGNVTLSDIGAMSNTTIIPTDTSQLTNGAGFVTNVVNDLTNYYLKSETYTKTEVQQLIASIPRFTVQVVQILPQVGEAMTLYLVPKDGEAPDVYNEYVWVEDTETFELLGTTAVDLDGYATEAWVQNQGYQTNAIESVTYNGRTQSITSKTANITSLIDLGEIDLSEYDDDVEMFYNTLTNNGSYVFVADDICYRVEVESTDFDGVKQVRQTMWTTEEGPSIWYFRIIVIEDGEVVDTFMNNYMTLDDGQGLFAGIYHQHVRVVNSSKTVWAYIETDLSYDSRNPAVIYADTTNNKNYIINCYAAVKSPLTRIVIVREMGDASCFYQRSNTYSAGRVTWGDWYKFSGTVFIP